MADQRLTSTRIRDAQLPESGTRYLWDAAQPGLGVRLTAGGARTFYARYKHDGRTRLVKLGTFPKTPLADARKACREVLQLADQGRDPAAEKQARREAATMHDLWAEYWERHALPHKKPSSSRKDQTNWQRHLRAALGARRVDEVTHDEVARLHAKIGKGTTTKPGTPGAANRCASLLSKMFACAERWGMRSPGTNPARGVQRFQERKIDRYLNDDEYGRLFEALGSIPEVLADVLRLLVHTGCRAGEVLSLRRGDVDAQRRELVLADGKTGGRRVPLSDEALAVVDRRLAATADTANGWLFPARTDPGKHVSHRVAWDWWRKACKTAKIVDARPHDLRHAFASVAINSGLSLTQVGGLLGHRAPATTARYAHLADDQQHINVRKVGRLISQAATSRPKVRRLRTTP